MIFELIAALFSADNFDDWSRRQKLIAGLVLGISVVISVFGMLAWLVLST